MSSEGPLPAGWEEYATAGGECYYFNTATNETTWERPTPPTREPVAAPALQQKPKQEEEEVAVMSRGNPMAGGVNRKGLLSGIANFDRRKLSAASAGAECSSGAATVPPTVPPTVRSSARRSTSLARRWSALAASGSSASCVSHTILQL